MKWWFTLKPYNELKNLLNLKEFSEVTGIIHGKILATSTCAWEQGLVPTAYARAQYPEPPGETFTT